MTQLSAAPMHARDTPWWSSRLFLIVMVLAAAIPLLKPAIPPIVDLPGHMGRYAVELAAPNSPLFRWYTFKWAIIGNLGVDLLVIPLSKLFGLELAVKLIVLAIPPLAVAGMLFVAREAHDGGLPPTAAFALPLAYGYPFQFGFANFVLSVSLALLGLGLWLRLGRTGHVRLRTGLFLVYGIVIWFTHSFGWGVLGLSAFAVEFARRWSAGVPFLRRLWQSAYAVLPLTPPILLMLVWRSGHVSGQTYDWFNWSAKYVYAYNVLRNEGGAFDIWCTRFTYLLGFCGLFWIGFRSNGVLLLVFFILAITYVLLPRIALGSAFADMRLVPFALAMLLLAMKPRVASVRIKGVIAAVAVCFFLVRIAVQTQSYDRLDQVYREQLAALDHLPVGSRVFALTNLTCLSTPYASRLDHIDGLAIVRRQAFTNGQWAMAGAQLLGVHYPAAAHFNTDPSQEIRPPHCRQRVSGLYPQILGHFPRAAFDYLWLINFTPDKRPHDPHFVPVWEAPRGALYRILSAAPVNPGAVPR
jgi:hypothetical protein